MLAAWGGRSLLFNPWEHTVTVAPTPSAPKIGSAESNGPRGCVEAISYSSFGQYADARGTHTPGSSRADTYSKLSMLAYRVADSARCRAFV
jgi:hypothetical protein